MAFKEEWKEFQEFKNLNKGKALEKAEVKFKYPFGKKVGRSQKKKNFVTVVIPYENGTIDFKKYKVDEQTILHENIPRLATAGHVMFDKKGNPVIILPNWSVEPFSPLDHYQKSLVNGTNSKGYKILLAKMMSLTVKDKPKMGGMLKWIMGLIVLGVIGYAIISGGGG